MAKLKALSHLLYAADLSPVHISQPDIVTQVQDCDWSTAGHVCHSYS